MTGITFGGSGPAPHEYGASRGPGNDDGSAHPGTARDVPIGDLDGRNVSRTYVPDGGWRATLSWSS